MSGKNRPEKQTKHRIAWHPAFYDVIRLELLPYKEVLRFEFEHPLNREPLKIDVIIIKKEKGVVLDKDIAAIFRDVNIIEYKSPEDRLTVADFHKVAAYTHLYCTTTGVGIKEMSMSFVTARRPAKMFRYLTEICGYKAEERGPGIYYINGGLVPIQIIVSKDLREGDNLWLKNLGREISTVSLSRILEKSPEVSREVPMGAYLGVLLEANPEQMREVLEMGDGRVSIEEVLVETGWAAKFESRGEVRGEARGEARGETRGKVQVAKNLMKNGFSPEQIVEFSGLDIKAVKNLYPQDKK